MWLDEKVTRDNWINRSLPGSSLQTFLFEQQSTSSVSFDAVRRYMNVIHYHRKPLPRYFSVERLFADIRGAFPADINCKVIVSRYPSQGVLPRIFNTLEAAFRQGDVNHITGDVHFLVLLLKKKKTLLTVLDCGIVTRRPKGIGRSLLKLFWYTLPVRRCAVVAAISEFTKTELIELTGCDAERVRVVHVPLGKSFQPSPRPFRLECPRLLHLGTSDNKNLDRSIEALKGIPCHLHIVGNPSSAQRAALDRNGIAYTADASLTDDQVLEAYRDCDVVLFPSTYEGFGMPIIEGQAIGRVVVAGNVCSMPEVAGGAACLVDPFDVQAIRAGVVRVIEDPEYRAELIHKGFVNAARFSPASIAAQYAQIYRELESASK